MNKSDKFNESERVIYKMKRSRRIMFLAASLLIISTAVSFPLFASLDAETKSSDYIWIALITSIILFLGIYMGSLSWRNRLVIFQERLEYYTDVYTLSTSWEKIERIDQVSVGLFTMEGPVLKEPAMIPSRWFPWAKFAMRINY